MSFESSNISDEFEFVVCLLSKLQELLDGGSQLNGWLEMELRKCGKLERDEHFRGW